MIRRHIRKAFSDRSAESGLFFLHPIPVDEAIEIVEREYDEVNKHRHVMDVGHGSESPQHYQHQIVGRICEGVIVIPAECQIRGEEACGDRYSARDDIGVAESRQYEIKDDGNDSGQAKHKDDLFL